MKRIILICLLTVVSVMLITTNIYATALPWLDFGDHLIWNSHQNTVTSGHLGDYGDYTFVKSLTYKDGSITPPPIFPPSDPVLYTPVSLSISFDGDNTNDYLKIGTWLSANLEVTGAAPDPLSASPNPFIVKIKSDGLTVDTGAGSRWADEFFQSIDFSLLYPAELRIAWLGAYIDLGGGLYDVNAVGKVNPIPEPGTLMLLGSGLMGVAFYHRRRKK